MRRPSPRSSPRSSASRPRTSRCATATPTSRPTASAPTAAARPRCPGRRSSLVSRKVRDKARLIAATMLEARPEDLAWEKGRWFVKGDPEQGATIEDIADARLQRRGAAGRDGGRPRRADHLRPAEPHLPVRRLHLRRRRRPRDGPGQGAPLHRGRRLRRADQPDGRRRPDPRRARRGSRDRADGADLVRQRGQLPQLLVHGLPDPDGAGVPRVRARRDGDARARTTRSAPRASASRRTSARRRRSSMR